MKFLSFRLPLLAAVAMLAVGCAGTHRFDPAQVPVISVGPGQRPVISWNPPEAYELSVYQGAEDGDGFGAIWSATMGRGYENDLRSPVTYGVPPAGSTVSPAPPLTVGGTYTVTVHRKDPRGTGEGFFNTRHRYVGKLTFVVTE